MHVFTEVLNGPLCRWRSASELRPAALRHLRTRGEETPPQSHGERHRINLVYVNNVFIHLILELGKIYIV